MTTFTDDFDRADSTDLGASWVEVSGDWSIISGQLAPDASGGTTILRAAAAMASSDHSVQFTIAATATASQGVWCRGNANITSGYLWRTSGSSWDLFSVVSGSFTVIGTYAVAVAPGDVAKVQAVGSTIKAFVNGVERVSVVNTDVPTGVNVGLRVMAIGGLRFDDFTAADVVSGATGDAAFSLTVALTAGGTRAVIGHASLALSADLMADGVTSTPPVLGSAALSVAGVLSAEGNRRVAAGSVLVAAATLTAAGATAVTGRATLSATSVLTAAGTTLSTRDDVDITVGVPHSRWAAGEPRDAGWEVGAPW